MKRTVKTYYLTISYEGLQEMLRAQYRVRNHLLDAPFRDSVWRSTWKQVNADISDIHRAIAAHPDAPQQLALPFPMIEG